MYLIRRIKLCLEQHGSLSSVISVKVLVNVLKIVEEKVRYFNNGMSIHRIQSLAGLGKMLRISYLYVTKNNKSVDLNDLGRLIIVVIENSYNLKLLK